MGCAPYVLGVRTSVLGGFAYFFFAIGGLTMLKEDLRERDKYQNLKQSYDAYRNLESGNYRDIMGEINKPGEPDADVPTCCICMEEFKPDDHIAVLKCDRRHMFHSHEIRMYLKEKLECPICRAPVACEP